MKKGKKLFAAMLLVLCMALCVSVFVACSLGNRGEKPQPAPHVHELTHVAEVTPDCKTEGNIEYWVCEECGKYFADKDGKSELTESAVKRGKTDHDYDNGVCSVCGKTDPAWQRPNPDNPDNPNNPDKPNDPDKPDKPHTQHTYGEWKTIENATCTEAGSKERVCSCGDKQTETISAKGHTEVEDKGKAATCTTDGKTAGKHCSECGTVLVAQTVIPAKGHTEVIDEAVTATCTTDGKTAGKHCSDCGAILAAQTVIPAKGHTEVEDKAVPATCTQTGLTAGKHCSVCNTILVEQTEIALLRHELNGDNTCGVCGKTFITDGLEFTLLTDCSSYEVSGIGTVTDAEIYIPAQHEGKPVTGIGYRAFYNCSSITSIEIPSSVESIGRSAFSGCSGLTSIEIPKSVTNIGSYAFTCCDELESFTVLKGNMRYHSSGNCVIETAEKTLVAGCKNSVIPSDGRVTSIGYGAFMDCDSLINIAIPNCVTSIEGSAFRNCNGLINITIPNSVTSIGSSAFAECENLTSVEMGNSVTHIGTEAFYKCAGLVSIELPNSVTDIDRWAFHLCRSLRDVTMGNGVTNIGYGTFESCENLASVTIGSSVTNIGGSAFSGCRNLTSIEIPQSVMEMGGNVFGECQGLMIYCEAVSAPSGWSSGWNSESCPVIWDCKNNDKDKDGYAYIIADRIWYRLNGGEATVVRQIGSIQEAIIAAQVTYEGNTYSVTSIEERAFQSCHNLMRIEIPSSVTSIGEYAFYRCEALTIYCEAVSAPSGWSVSWNRSTDSIDCPVVWDCKNNDRDEYGYAYTIVDGIRYRLDKGEAKVIEQASSIQEAKIPAQVMHKGSVYSVTSIGNGAFSGCERLTSIEIPNSITSIGQSAIYNCSSLASIVIPNSVTSIGESTFSNCSSLISVTIGNDVVSIGREAFSGCSSLTSIVISDSVTSIGYSAFKNCDKLSEIYYTATEEEWNAITINSNGNDSLASATVYYYCETQPTRAGNYWHYDENGAIVKW